jgi:hypothetical protein
MVQTFNTIPAPQKSIFFPPFLNGAPRHPRAAGPRPASSAIASQRRRKQRPPTRRNHLQPAPLNSRSIFAASFCAFLLLPSYFISHPVNPVHPVKIFLSYPRVNPLFSLTKNNFFTPLKNPIFEKLPKPPTPLLQTRCSREKRLKRVVEKVEKGCFNVKSAAGGSSFREKLDGEASDPDTALGWLRGRCGVAATAQIG